MLSGYWCRECRVEIPAGCFMQEKAGYPWSYCPACAVLSYPGFQYLKKYVGKKKCVTCPNLARCMTRQEDTGIEPESFASRSDYARWHE